MAARDLTLDQALPDNLDAERFILGAIMSNESAYLQVAGALAAEDFSLEKHKRIFLRMGDLHERGDKIDRVTLANELMKQGQLQSVDGLSYLVSLDDGLPHLHNLESYVAIVKEKALLRRIISVSQDAINRCLTAEGEAHQILGAVEDALMKLGDDQTTSTLLNPAQIITEYEGGINAFLDTSKRIKGISTGFLKFDELTGGLREGELFILAARPAMGKAQPLHAPVKTLSGWKPIGELRVGDSLVSTDGQPSSVTGIFPQGKKKIYKITFSDGRSAECCGEHLWKVQYRHWNGGSKTITTDKIADLLTKKRYQSRLSIPLICGEFGSEEPPISPWLLGYLIGDGSFCRGQLSVTSADGEIVERLQTELVAYNCKLTPQSDIDYRISLIEKTAPPASYAGGERRRRLTVAEKEELCEQYKAHISTATLSANFEVSQSNIYGLLKRRGVEVRGSQATNPLVKVLKNIGLYGLASQEKFIPPCYFEASRQTRLELLRGLMDSDGTAEKFGAVTFSTSSEQLARDVQYLVRSLGGISKIAKRSKSFTYRGEKKIGLPAYIVSVIMDDPSEVFWLERKKRRAVRVSKNRPHLRIISVEQIGEADAVCISVSHPSHLYMTSDFTVTHNTALALNIAQHVATSPTNPKAVAVFSLEMSKESLLTRMLCAAARVDQQRFRAGYLNADERRSLQEAMYRIVEAPLYLDDTAGTNLMDVHSKLRRLQAEQELGLVVIDYLQLMQGRGRFENRVQEISSLSRGLKLMSKELRVPFLVLSQLSRAPESRPGDHRPMLSDLRESGCLTGDTLIPIPCSGKRVPIRELVDKPKFRVWALNEKTLKLEKVLVSNAFSTGIKPVFELRTQLGRTVRATANHPFRTFSGWKRLDELATGEYLALPRIVPAASTQTMSDAELALLGHLIGDGCTLPRHIIQYTTRERELAELVSALATEVFGDEISPRISSERTWFQVYLSSTRAHTHNVHSPITDWLTNLGAFGLRAWEKRIPQRVFEQSPEGIATFLRHLWATDGCINLRKTGARRTPILYYATSSETLAQDLQSLLLRLEINARLKRVRITPGKKGRDQFHVIITGAADVRRAIDRMGAVGQRRLEALDSLRDWIETHPANPNRDIVPRDIWREVAVPAMQAANVSTRQMFSALETAYCGTSIYKQNISRTRATRLGEILQSQQIQALASSDLYWDAVVSVTPAGMEEVYDLTVPDHHNFVANDFVVHNSIEQDADMVGFIFREEVYRPDKESLKGLAELILAKQRNGPTGRVKLAFLNRFTKFENLATDTGDDEVPFTE